MWPAVSWTVQPWHQDGAAHCGTDSPVQVSAICARSEWMCFQVSPDFIRIPLCLAASDGGRARPAAAGYLRRTACALIDTPGQDFSATARHDTPHPPG